MKKSSISKNLAHHQKIHSLPPVVRVPLVEKHRVRVLRSEEGKVTEVNCLENQQCNEVENLLCLSVLMFREDMLQIRGNLIMEGMRCGQTLMFVAKKIL
jgi:hypothetical protein